MRENARLQGFPDWFEFKGKYTTGGHLRRREVPRFTQVANAVPPLMAEVIGSALLKIWRADRGRDPAHIEQPDSIHSYVHKNGNAIEILPMLDKVTS